MGPSVLLPSAMLAGSVSDRLDLEIGGIVFPGGKEARVSRSSANSAMASVRLRPSKLAGELRRGRSGNMFDSVDNMRLGERGLSAGPFSSFVSSFSLRGSGGITVDCGDSGDGLTGGKKEPFAVADEPGAKSKLPNEKVLLLSD